MNQDLLEPRYKADRIASRVADIAALLDREFPQGDLVLISILKGASFFLSDLARQMKNPVGCEYISVRREEGSDQVLQIDFRTDFAVGGRPVLVLKDVINSGVIESYLIDHLLSQGAARVQLAAIIDRTDRRTTDIIVDYSLFAVPRGIYAGYGMGYQGRYAHLSYIAEVAQAPPAVATDLQGQ